MDSQGLYSPRTPGRGMISAAWLTLAVLGLIAVAGLSARPDHAPSVGMSTATKAKPAKTPALSSQAAKRKFRLGYAKKKITVAAGVDLTKPTLPPGKYL